MNWRNFRSKESDSDLKPSVAIDRGRLEFRCLNVGGPMRPISF